MASEVEMPEPVTFEQMYLMAIIEELRGLRADIAKLNQEPESPVKVRDRPKKKVRGGDQ